MFKIDLTSDQKQRLIELKTSLDCNRNSDHLVIYTIFQVFDSYLEVFVIISL
jgi:hypothetical protein